MSPVNTNQLTIFELVGYLFSGIYLEFVVLFSLFIFYQDQFGTEKITKIIKTFGDLPTSFSWLLVTGAFVLAYGFGIVCSQFSLFYYYGDNRLFLRWFFEEPDHYPFKTFARQNPAKHILIPWEEIFEKLNEHGLISNKALRKARKYPDNKKYLGWGESYKNKQNKESSRKARVLVDQIHEQISFLGQFLSTLDRTASRIRFISSFVLTNVLFCIYLIALLSYDYIWHAKREQEFILVLIFLIILFAKFLIHSFVYKSNRMKTINFLPRCLARSLRKTQQFLRHHAALFHLFNLFTLNRTSLLSFCFALVFIVHFELVYPLPLFILLLLLITALAHSEIARKDADYYWLTIGLACTMYCKELNEKQKDVTDL